MPDAKEFSRVATAVLELLPLGVDIVGIEITKDARCVTIWTTHPKEVIGRRGAVVAEISERLAVAVGWPVTFNVELPDGDIYGVPARQRTGTGAMSGVPRPRIWRREPTAEELRGSIVPPEWG